MPWKMEDGLALALEVYGAAGSLECGYHAPARAEDAGRTGAQAEIEKGWAHSNSLVTQADPRRTRRARTLEQIPWTTYFERDLHFKSPTTKVSHHAYLNSPAAPTSKSPLFIFHHGAGSSGLSFAVLSSEIRKLLPNAGMLSVDARGHGSTALESGELDLSLETLTDDLLFVVRATKDAMGWEGLPPVLLVGHSLGGAVVTNLAKRGDLGASVLGFAVLDVVEGSAMDALQSMITYLSTRPSGFPSLESGIDWHVRSRTLRNATSARTSVPALLVKDGEGPRAWRWRTDLAATQRFWEGWFSGLSKKFLEARGGKLLLLAGTDRLDTELTIGQMQGESRPLSSPRSHPQFICRFRCVLLGQC